MIGSTLTAARFRGAVMERARLVSAALSDADFENANLHKARLFQANGRDVNFAGANLVGAEAVHSHFMSSLKTLGDGRVLKTNFDGAWVHDFVHHGAVSPDLLSNAIAGRLPAEGKFLASPAPNDEKILVNGLPGSDRVLYEAALEELNEMIGLREVKDRIRRLADMLEVSQARAFEHGLPRFRQTLHRVYSGPPGTGKTTVARIEARLFHALGILPKGNVVETDKSGFIAGFAGQTLGKTNDLINEALGGVLFADEIYALTQSQHDDYARDAVAVLTKRLWDDRDKFACICAGYTGPMEQFLEANPGLKRRFPVHIKFPAYSSGELVDIAKVMLGRVKLDLYDREFLAAASLLFAAAREKDGEQFGNAGTVEIAVEKTCEAIAVRLKADGQVHDRKAQQSPGVSDLPFAEIAGAARKKLPHLNELTWKGADGSVLTLAELTSGLNG